MVGRQLPKIRNVIFDIGNVVIHWRPYDALSHLFSDEKEMTDTLNRIGFFEWNAEQDRGRSWADGFTVASIAHPTHTHIYEHYAKGLEAAHCERVAGTSEIIAGLHDAGINLYGLTNAWLETFEIMKNTAPNLSLFRHITVSAEVGMIKPELNIYEHCLSHNNLESSQTLFVDDSPKNCDGARAAGMIAHCFVNAEQLSIELKAFGLL